MKTLFQLPLFGLALLLGCESQPTVASSSLTSGERRLCDSLRLDTSLVTFLRMYNASRLEPFQYSGYNIYKDGKVEPNPIHLSGVVFKEPYATSTSLVERLYPTFHAKGYSVFVLEQHFNLQRKPDDLAIVKTPDKYTVIRYLQTDAGNYDISNDSLVGLIQKLDARYSLDLIGAGSDWCEFVIRKEPADWLAFAKEVYALCPDIVDQGTGTVEALAEEQKRTKHLYLWWD